MLIVLISLGLMAILIDTIAFILFKPDQVTIAQSREWPMVTVLVPMRNEAANVKALLENLLQLDYPKDKMEILIGEDRSADQTAALLEKLASVDSRISVISVKDEVADLGAKANVVAQLIPHCRGNYYFITDADVRVPPNWLKAYLSANKDSSGVVGGTTVVEVHDYWSGLQNIDWILGQGLLFVAGKAMGTVAVSGTNMMITRDLCNAIGGYGNIPFWLTEDIGVLTAAKRSGFKGLNLLDEKVAAIIQAQPNWRTLISQRSRWTYGVLRLPKVIVMLLLVRALFLINVVLIGWWSLTIAAGLYLVKTTIDWFFVQRVANSIGQTVSVKHFLFFELYWFLMAVSGLLTHLFSTNTRWKDRSY